MTTLQLDCHPASHKELILAHESVHTIWSKGLPIKQHVEARLQAPHHRRANWYVGTVDGELAVSLGAYPMKFQLKEETIPGFAIGSVYTKELFRKQGFASQLLTWVENHELKKFDRKISSLYSDINPKYYEKHGYLLCPSFQSQTGLDQLKFTGTEDFLSFEEFDKHDHKDEMKRLYSGYHQKNLFSILRSDDYWEMILEKFPDDRYFWLKNSGSQTVGYLRLQIINKSLRITDYALANHDDSLFARMYASLIQKAIEENCQTITGWVPDCHTAHQFFEIRPRKTEITMIKPLDDSLHINSSVTEASNFFCEIDHV